MPERLNLLHVDDRLLMVDKPSGLLAVPGRGPDLQDCLSARLLDEFPTLRIVHRLDRDTSGVMVFALDLECQRALSRQFEQRQVEKEYLAVVRGAIGRDESPHRDHGTIELPIRKDFDHPPRHQVDLEQGRAAITHWRVLERWADRTRLSVTPETGRSHQIRLHLASLGHPILGDNLYADEATRAMSRRLLLHSLRLAIRHPDDGRTLSVACASDF